MGSGYGGYGYNSGYNNLSWLTSSVPWWMRGAVGGVTNHPHRDDIYPRAIDEYSSVPRTYAAQYDPRNFTVVIPSDGPLDTERIVEQLALGCRPLSILDQKMYTLYERAMIMYSGAVSMYDPGNHFSHDASFTRIVDTDMDPDFKVWAESDMMDGESTPVTRVRNNDVEVSRFKYFTSCTETKCVAVVYTGCRSDQTSADAYIEGDNVGAMTTYHLKALANTKNTTMADVCHEERKALKANRYAQVPQLNYGSLARESHDAPHPFSVNRVPE